MPQHTQRNPRQWLRQHHGLGDRGVQYLISLPLYLMCPGAAVRGFPAADPDIPQLPPGHRAEQTHPRDLPQQRGQEDAAGHMDRLLTGPVDRNICNMIPK